MHVSLDFAITESLIIPAGCPYKSEDIALFYTLKI
jgi:hypothetical protein